MKIEAAQRIELITKKGSAKKGFVIRGKSKFWKRFKWLSSDQGRGYQWGSKNERTVYPTMRLAQLVAERSMSSGDVNQFVAVVCYEKDEKDEKPVKAELPVNAKIWLQPGYEGNSKYYGNVRDSIILAMRNKYAEDAVDFVFGRHYWEPKNYPIWEEVRGPLFNYFKEEGLK